MLVFVHMNKTGGTTLTHILRSTYGPRHCQVEPWSARWKGAFSTPDLRRLRKIYPHLKSIAGHRVTAYADLQEEGTEFKYLTFMRDPLKLCASRFQYKVNVSQQQDLVFEEWIQRDWTRNHQTKWIAGVDDVNEAIRIIKEKNIFVGLTERYDESIVLLKALVANDLNISYKRVNVARDKTLAKTLLSTESTRALLIEAQQSDLELYEYVKNELYPTFQQAYGPSLDKDVADYQRENQSGDFNHLNLTLARLKHYALYAPLLALYRRRNKAN